MISLREKLAQQRKAKLASSTPATTPATTIKDSIPATTITVNNTTKSTTNDQQIPQTIPTKETTVIPKKKTLAEAMAQRKQIADGGTGFPDSRTPRVDTTPTSSTSSNSTISSTGNGLGSSTISTPTIATATTATTATSPTIPNNGTNPTTTVEKGTVEKGKSEVSFEDLNEAQRTSVKLAVQRESFCLVGAAGSGKTTTVKIMLQALLDNNHISTFTVEDANTCKFAKVDMPRIAILSYTNPAVRNIKESVPELLKNCCSTLHALTEFVPVEYVDEDDLDDNGMAKTKRNFAPTFGSAWREAGGQILPHLDIVVIEEAGSVSLELFELLVTALPNPEDTQFIFLGDLNQLTPPFNDGILGFKKLELPIIELTEVYRNVGIITKLAHRILTGKPILEKEVPSLVQECPITGDSIKINRFPDNNVPEEKQCRMLGLQFQHWIKERKVIPEDTMVLIPFNKRFGTTEFNKYIMQGITDRDGLEVYEVIAHYVKSYWCIGDRVVYNKVKYQIVDIIANSEYRGERPVLPSRYLTRFGTAKSGHREEVFGIGAIDAEEDDFEALMNTLVVDVEEEDSTKKASHSIVLQPLVAEDGTEITLKSGAINNMLPLYAMTVHKSQGSEAERVILILHHSHSIMASRELLYTGVTRARHHLNIMYSGNTTGSVLNDKYSMLYKCVVKQQIVGKTVHEKLKVFKKKALAYIASGADGNIKRRLVSLRDTGKLI